MNAQAGEHANVIHRGDAAGCGDFVVRCLAKPLEPGEIGALHHAFFVYIRAEKAAAVGFKARDYILSPKICCLFPAFDHNAPILTVERNQQTVSAYSFAKFRKKFVVWSRGRESRCSNDDAISSLFRQLAGASYCPYTTANASLAAA